MSVEFPLVTKKHYSEGSGISESMLKRLIADGVIPVVELYERTVLINNSKLDELCRTGQLNLNPFKTNNQLTRIK